MDVELFVNGRPIECRRIIDFSDKELDEVIRGLRDRVFRSSDVAILFDIHPPDILSIHRYLARTRRSGRRT